MNLIVVPARLLDFVPEASKNTYLGLLTSAGLLVAVVVQPLAGAASDTSRSPLGKRRPYLLAGSVLAAVALAGLGWAPGILAFLLAYLGLQLCSNIAQGPYQGFIPDMVPGEKRGRASAAKLGAEVLGVIALAPATAYFIQSYRSGGGAGWLWLSLGSLAALLVLASLATVLLVRERGGRPGAAPPWTSRGRKALDLRWAEHPEFRWYLLSRFFVLVALGSIQAFAYYYLDDVVGVSSPARTVGYLAVIGGGMVLALAYPVGRLGDRWGRKTMLYLAGFIGSLGVLGLLLSRSELQVLLSGALLGVATCIFLVNSWALATDLAPAERAAHYLGLVNVAALGGVVARLWGPVIDLLNARQPGQGYMVLLLGCLVYITMGTALLGLVRQSKAREGALL